MIKNYKFQIKNLLVLFSLLISAKSIYAVTLTYFHVPSTISTEPFDFSVTVNGANSGTNYLRIDLFKEGTNNYFGETYNGTSWYQGSEGNQYYPVTIGADKIATASVQGKVGQPSFSDYPTPGEYYLRIRRYTESGNPAGNDEQTPIKVTITAAAASPTPTPEPTPKQTPSPTATALPISTPRSTPRPRPRVTNSPQAAVATSSSSSPKVLGNTQNNKSSLFPTNPPTEATTSGSIAFPAGALLVVGGGILSGVAGFLAYKKTQQKD